MRLACLSDVHIDQRSIYYDDLIGVVRRIIDDAAGQQIDAWCLAGDLAGRESRHRMTDAERLVWAELLCAMASIAPVYAIPGNHDTAGSVLLFPLLRSRYPITIATEPMTVAHDDEWTFALRPYRTQPELTGLDDLPIEERNVRAGREALGRTTDAHTIAIAHFPAEGASCGSFEVSAAQEVMLSTEALDTAGYAFTVLGHIHQRQRVASRAAYCGSPAPLAHGEVGPKGYMLVDLPPTGEPEVEWRDIASWRMETFRAYYDGGVGLPPLTWPDMATRATGAHVRVLIATPMDWKGVLPRREITDLFTKAGALSVRVDPEPAQGERSRSEAIVTATSDQDMLRAALGEMGIAEPETTALVQLSDEMVAAEASNE